MEPNYKFIDHTADILFQAEASTLPELFTQCALALEDSQVDINLIEEKETLEFNVENKSIEGLLFDFLDDLVYYKDADLLIFKKFILEINESDKGYKLNCKATGDKLDHAKHDPKVDVKAITMHMFEVKQVKDGWTAQVLIDI